MHNKIISVITFKPLLLLLAAEVYGAVDIVKVWFSRAEYLNEVPLGVLGCKELVFRRIPQAKRPEPEGDLVIWPCFYFSSMSGSFGASAG